MRVVISMKIYLFPVMNDIRKLYIPNPNSVGFCMNAEFLAIGNPAFLLIAVLSKTSAYIYLSYPPSISESPTNRAK